MKKIVATLIEVRFQFEGIHCWPEAKAPVAFLSQPHRHIFHVRARMNVEHDDRALEFIIVKQDLLNFVRSNFFKGQDLNLGRMSCEQMAQQIAFFIRDKWDRDTIEVEVSEDGENGAVVKYE